MNVRNKTEVFKLLEQNKGKIRNYGVNRIGLFGSYVRNEQSPNSDVDLLVEFIEGKKSLQSYMGLYDLMESLFNNRVDLLTKESISKHILPYINEEIEYIEV